ncbi:MULTISPECIES: 50S ribosomal protein L25/general stress protein Ctc [unclassified Aureispira]|uniref:50S ribosomal protein L25/general stress protein Ctc n=1 Tax=unclassified Aureispira TaxID=2649989 RepID=UPI000698098F|nr:MULTISPECIES: 50S ribosomal protein L25/general stress protein Ctc [unclassified Aureispira]WMX14852.1 50S ribosomal protein L25/general stress protein Ctc [Aureispira sp. CCB-E]
MKTIALSGTSRTELGKKSTKALRNAGLVPCVLYGGEKNLHFSLTTKALRDLIYTNEFRTAEVELDGAKYNAIIKTVQFHPVTDAIQHVDLLELVEGQSVKAEIPIKLVGTAKGVKVGGVLMQKIRKVKVKTTPDKLSSFIEVNVEHLMLGKSIRVREIQVEEGIEIMNAGGIPLASVEVPRALRSAEARSAAESAQ